MDFPLLRHCRKRPGLLGRGKLQKKLKSPFCNPLLFAILAIVLVLLAFDIPYESYNNGGAVINMFLAPGYRLPGCIHLHPDSDSEGERHSDSGGLHRRIPVLHGSVYVLCRLFGLDEAMTASLLPKSITTPIAVEVCQSHGGIVPVTVIAVIFTGILGSILAPYLIRIFRVKNPITAGLAIGACSHAVGTSKALELGETEGAMSGLAIGVCGIMTVIFSMVLL